MTQSFAGLTPSAIREACAESGASEMLVSPALILALLDAAEAGRELREAVEVLQRQGSSQYEIVKMPQGWRAAHDIRNGWGVTRLTLTAALIALAEKINQ